MECFCSLTLPDPNLSKTWKEISILATLIICVSQKSHCLQAISFLCKEVGCWGRESEVQAASLLTFLHEQFILIHPENRKLIWDLHPQLLLLCISFWDRVSCRADWSTTCSVTKAILELQNFLPSPLKCWDYRGAWWQPDSSVSFLYQEIQSWREHPCKRETLYLVNSKVT